MLQLAVLVDAGLRVLLEVAVLVLLRVFQILYAL